MNISPIVDKTVFIKTLNNKDIEVATLPKQTRYEVDTLDRLNQQRMDAVCHLEILELAIRAQKMKIGELIKGLTVEATPEPLLEHGHTHE
jgi:hypothetical protein